MNIQLKRILYISIKSKQKSWHKWNKYVQNELKTKLNDLNLLEQTINKQYQLLIGLNNDLNISKKHEKALIIDYENI